MIDDDLWHSIRVLYFRKGKKKSWIAKELGLSRNTVKKYIASDDAPAYKLSKPRGRPVSNEWEEHVRSMLEQDQDAPRKQHHTARRVFDRLVEEHGYDGGLRTVQYMVANIRQNQRDTFVPLQFEAGKDAQVDYGEAYAIIDGRRTKLYGFEMRLNYSRHKFQMYFPSPNMESFMEGHVRAFEFFAGVPARISYDNLTLAVVSVGKGKQRKLTKSFKQLMGHYAFEANFCTPGKSGAHEKGGVENGIGYRMVPMPKVGTIEELNAYLLQKCSDDMERTVHGQKQSIAAAFDLERDRLMPIPVGAFDPGVRKSGSVVDGYQTISFDKNRYSVPLEHVGKPLWFKAYWNRVLIRCKTEIIAEHVREHGEDLYVLKAEHYFDLLERRPQAVQFARPLLQVEWPSEYWQFFQRIKNTRGASDAGREFVRLLRLHSKHGESATKQALEEAATAGALSADVVMQILDRARYIRQILEPIDLSGRPELNIAVVLSETEQYQQLLGGGNEHCAA